MVSPVTSLGDRASGQVRSPSSIGSSHLPGLHSSTAVLGQGWLRRAQADSQPPGTNPAGQREDRDRAPRLGPAIGLLLDKCEQFRAGFGSKALVSHMCISMDLWMGVRDYVSRQVRTLTGVTRSNSSAESTMLSQTSVDRRNRARP